MLPSSAGARDPDRRPAGGPGGGRRVAGPPGPTVRLPGRRGRGRVRGARGTGAGAVRGATARRLRARAAGHQRQRPGAESAVQGDLGRTGAAPPRSRPWSARSPTTTRAASPTCCGWPCPPRHAATEKAEPARAAAAAGAARPAGSSTGRSRRTRPVRAAGRAASGGSPRAYWQVIPAHHPSSDWADGFAAAARATADSGRGSVLVVPDQRDLARLRAACTRVLGRTGFVELTAEAGPAARYRAFLAALRGDVRVVIGNRAAAYAPVRDLGLVALWDDGDDLLAEQRAPYPHTRDGAGAAGGPAAERGAGRRLRPQLRGRAVGAAGLAAGAGRRPHADPAHRARGCGRPSTPTWPWLAIRRRGRRGCRTRCSSWSAPACRRVRC